MHTNSNGTKTYKLLDNGKFINFEAKDKADFLKKVRKYKKENASSTN